MLEAVVVRKRKQEAVPAMYVSLIKNETLANILLKLNFIREEKKHPNFESDTIATTVTNKATICKIVNII